MDYHVLPPNIKQPNKIVAVNAASFRKSNLRVNLISSSPIPRNFVRLFSINFQTSKFPKNGTKRESSNILTSNEAVELLRLTSLCYISLFLASSEASLKLKMRRLSGNGILNSGRVSQVSSFFISSFPKTVCSSISVSCSANLLPTKTVGN